MSTLMRNLMVLNRKLKSFNIKALSSKSSSQRSSNKSDQSQPRKVGACLVVGLTAGAVSYYFYEYNNRTKDKFVAATKIRNDLPSFSVKNVTDRRYYVYGVGVYDLNDYAKNQHPGGEEAITEMVGRDFGEIWSREGMKFHETKEILELLEGMRVGNFEGAVDKPERCKTPKVGEGPLCLVPQVDPKEYKLELALNNGNIVKALTLEELRRYPKHSIVSSIPCKSDPTKKEAGPTWTGVQLRDILQEWKIKKTNYDEIRFECLDASSATDKPYGTTVPIDRVVNEPSFEVLLAYEKDNTVISPQHGFPIRVVMPQAAGAKNVKWLKRIVLVKKTD